LICVLDACALIAWLKNEPGEDTICALLDRAQDGEDSLYMGIVNLLEVCYGFYRELGVEKTALELSAHFATSDYHELEEIERNEPIPFLWLPPKPHYQ
jgi:predicted nucleic acid-binding protein